jgi:hypothetical protein
MSHTDRQTWDEPVSRWVQLVVPGLLLAIGLFTAFYPTLLSGFTQVQQDLGDPRLVNYLLEHGFRWVHGWPGHESLWDPPFYHPARNIGALHDTLIGLGLLYWPVRWAGLPPDTAYQVFMLAVSSLNFAAAYLFMRRGLRVENTPAAAGAFLFAFANVRMARLLHQQLVAAYLPVLAILCVVLAFRSERRRQRTHAIWAFFALLTLQMWSGFYHAWYLILSLGLAMAWAGLSRRLRMPVRAFLLDSWVAVTAGGVAFLAASSPMILRHLAAARDVGFHDFAGDVLPRTAHLASWLYMGTPNLMYGLLQERAPFASLPMPVEHQLASGLVTTVVALAGLWLARHRPLVRLMVAVGATLAVLSTVWPGGFTLWTWVYELVPGGAAIRAPARSALIMLLPLSAGFALAVGGLERRGRFTVAALVLSVGIIEQVRYQPSFDKLRARDAVSRIASEVPEECPAFYVMTVPSTPGPLPYNPWKYHLDAMWAQLAVGSPTVNGYSGFQAAGWLPLYDNVVRDEDDRARLGRALTQWLDGRTLQAGCVVEVSAATR